VTFLQRSILFDDAVVTMLAKLVIELAWNGERDPERLRAAVIAVAELRRNP
jgi:hypothetical protein